VTAAGDDLRVTAEIEAGTVYFSVYDYTLEKSWHTSTKLEGRFAYPATAEMIAERPSLKSGLPELSKFAPLIFESNRAAQEEGLAYPLSDYSTESFYMHEGEDKLATPTTVFAYGKFGVEWLRCH
jgi:hypothetical protein